MMEFPIEIKNAASILKTAGQEAYVVGGSLRNILMGKAPKDFDMTTSATPEEICDIFEPLGYHVIKTGMKHGTVTILLGEMPIEITTFRVDGSYTDSRHPDSVCFTRSITEDLARRDFTVNAMALDPVISGDIIDPFCGARDLERRILRCVGDPKKRFSEDALRILRAFRFVSEHGFKIEEATYSAIAEQKDGLKKISRERILSELERTLVGDDAISALRMMLECGVMSYILPSANISAEDIERVGALPKHVGVRLAALLWGADDVNASLSSLKVSNALKKEVTALLGVKDRRGSADAKTARKLVFSLGELADNAALLAEVFGDEELAEALETAKNEKFPRSMKELAVSGGDIAELGAVGGEIGALLSALLDRVLERPETNERNELLRLARELLKVTCDE